MVNHYFSNFLGLSIFYLNRLCGVLLLQKLGNGVEPVKMLVHVSYIKCVGETH